MGTTFAGPAWQNDSGGMVRALTPKKRHKQRLRRSRSSSGKQVQRLTRSHGGDDGFGRRAEPPFRTCQSVGSPHRSRASALGVHLGRVDGGKAPYWHLLGQRRQAIQTHEMRGKQHRRLHLQFLHRPSRRRRWQHGVWGATITPVQPALHEVHKHAALADAPCAPDQCGKHRCKFIATTRLRERTSTHSSSPSPAPSARNSGKGQGRRQAQQASAGASA